MNFSSSRKWGFVATAGLATTLTGLAAYPVALNGLSTAVIDAALFTLLAIVAGLFPTRDTGRYAALTYAMPFIAGILVLAGTAAATLGAFLAISAGLVLRDLEEHQRVVPRRLVRALIASTLGVLASGLAWKLLLGRQPVELALVVGIPGFVFLGVLLAHALDDLMQSVFPEVHSIDHTRPASRWYSAPMVLILLTSIAVALLVRDKHVAVAPILLAPLFMLRQAAIARTQMFEQYYETITALCLMLQRAHPYTHGHLERVARIAEQVAIRLGFERSRARMVREAAVLHDIGKIAVDDAVLDKPAKLDDVEMAHVRQHARFGAEILTPVPQFRQIVPWIRHHHERPDGTGYPDGLADPQIPIESKIIAVVDAFDAMTGGEMGNHPRPYRKPLSVEDALVELDRCSGTQFDAKVVEAFREFVREAPSL